MARTPLTQHWTEQEIAMLRAMLASGVNPRAAALKLRRKFSSVRRKISQIQAGDQETTQQSSGRARRPARVPTSTQEGEGTF
jgi:hypothetical protein